MDLICTFTNFIAYSYRLHENINTVLFVTLIILILYQCYLSTLKFLYSTATFINIISIDIVLSRNIKLVQNCRRSVVIGRSSLEFVVSNVNIYTSRWVISNRSLSSWSWLLMLSCVICSSETNQNIYIHITILIISHLILSLNVHRLLISKAMRLVF